MSDLTKRLKYRMFANDLKKLFDKHRLVIFPDYSRGIVVSEISDEGESEVSINMDGEMDICLKSFR